MFTRFSTYFRFFTGIVIVLMSVWIAILFKPHTLPITYVQNHYDILLILIVCWIVISILFKKYDLGSKRDLRRILPAVLRINIIIAGVTTLTMYGLRELELSRFVLFVTIIAGTFLELVFFITYKQLVHSKKIDDSLQDFIETRESLARERAEQKREKARVKEGKHFVSSHISSYIIQESGEEVYRLINKYFDLTADDYTILSTTTRFNVLKLPDDSFSAIANLKRINDIRYVNKFFEAVNTKICTNGLFIGCVETKNMRKKRIMRKFPPVLNVIYYTFDFIFKRLAPKFNITKKLYFFLTRGQNRVISKAETLGRLYSCGFDVEEIATINNHLYFVGRKIRKPYKDTNPTYGPLIKLRRVGKGGKEFYVYKFRTMHPFSEYLQPYIYKHYNLKEGGKFKNDFRVTTIGKFMRKFWIDELPMLINWIKGEMKLVGVRPLSTHYYNLYAEEVKQERTKAKPGLVPPFYADMPTTLEEIQASELKYLKAYQKHPFRTDWCYFWRAMFNIMFKNARSA
ncbi:UDP-glucose:undecaprenyl-phosphate glucose-1-phosphate transferase [Salinivirga cyanobacteriivorans]|uniref:UDP-glucose:undecaprenyl-phosphate glucose-1-phosphate transferase n=1 Tax=Salinivirga cyanobacteriivorans TaxID=1307839 RepID=A0A0S2I056_9BACT|nr:sugar transferase [Salinivirga cyanobacteriivorans]ALO15747.1 UDP-glucose:undecaprenyl-phosphate glucose-1-phosphate transferase [Salinivirga cyanobacteriivorans]